ncbi:major facilitator superfamily domain-containing protein 4A [Galendromus occidentalis]|uniref:Major facilitator superfamily domain-containing protein 4A n=1 Tax=Galendromus occidentalis TaxID=34638 RepID=A0AAJ6VZH2_9ACAR|nr:major facilitator superfamily domain-containing protein 4A [Galendromus occidentalis]
MTEKSRRSRMDYWHTANLIMIVFSVGLVNSLLGPFLMDMAEIYSSAMNEVAVMNSARAIGLFIGSCVGGFLYERINDQILMIIMGAVYGVGTVLHPLLPDLTYFHVLGFILGVAIGISHIGSQVRLVTLWAEDSAPAIQAIHASYGVGATIGPFVGAPFLSLRENDIIVKETRIYIPYAASGFLFFLILISMIAAYCVDPIGIKKAKESKKVRDDDSSRAFETVLMALLVLYLTTSVNIESTFSTLISVYAHGSPLLEFSKPDAAYLAGVFWTTFTGGRIVSIFVAAFFDVKKFLLVSHSLVLCASGILVLFGSSAACTWIGVALMGSGVSAMYGAAKALVFKYFHLRHFHISMILTGACLGIAVPAYFVPPVVERWPMFLPYYIGTCNISHLIVLLLMFNAVRGKRTIHEANEKPKGIQKEDALP